MQKHSVAGDDVVGHVYLLELGELVGLAQLFEVRHRLGVVETVLVVDFTVTRQLTKLHHHHHHRHHQFIIVNQVQTGCFTSKYKLPSTTVTNLLLNTKVCYCRGTARYAGKSKSLWHTLYETSHLKRLANNGWPSRSSLLLLLDRPYIINFCRWPVVTTQDRFWDITTLHRTWLCVNNI